MNRLSFSALSLLFLLVTRSVANDISVSNVSTFLEEGQTIIEFDVSWKNSWRVSVGPSNYDAAWVFAKYKGTDGIWRHIQFNGSHNNPTGALVVDADDWKGYFIYRAADGTGDFTVTDVRLGIEAIAGTFELKVFAIEMVYIPQAGFVAGDANGTAHSAGSLMLLGVQPVNIAATLKQDITSEGGSDDERLNTLGIGIAGDGGLDTNNDGTIDNPLYPTGYKAFYCMKYEVSQRGIIDFLNTLTFEQQDYLGTNPAGEQPPGIGNIMLEVQGVGGEFPVPATFGVDADGNFIYNESKDGEWIAASDMDWRQMAAYLDWAALRPMTELEFEKICRGTLPSQLGEYVWGTTGIVSTGYTISEPHATNEFASPLVGDGNANYNGLNSRPLRSGIFATGTPDRKSAAAAYYGPMDMGGNVAEVVVSLGNVAGRSFTGKLGDGTLTEQGYANEDHWPGINGNDNPSVANGPFSSGGVSQLAGIGVRGGDYTDGAALLRLSNRQHATFMTLPLGGRGVRQVD